MEEGGEREEARPTTHVFQVRGVFLGWWFHTYRVAVMVDTAYILASFPDHLTWPGNEATCL